MERSFKLLKFPEKDINTERLKSILIAMYSQESIEDEYLLIDGILSVIESHFYEMEDFMAEQSAVKVMELRALIERVYSPYI